MTELDFNEEEFDTEEQALAALKNKADLIGVKYHPSIGYDKLYEKVQQHLESEGVNQDYVAPEDAGLVAETNQEKFARIRKDMKSLVRVQVQCLDPLKKGWEAEVLTIANDLTTIRRCVPYNTPWHIERSMAAFLEERQYQYFIEKRNERGEKYKVPMMGKAYQVTYLDELTEDQIKQLAIKQARQGI